MAVSTTRLARWIEIVSWCFVVLGLLLPSAFHSGAFAVYRDALARWAYDRSSVAPGDEQLLGLMLGITGGSIAGKWIVHARLARGPLAEGKAWARDLTLRGLAAWFFVDSLASLLLGATFNVWMINLLPLALVGLPLAVSYTAFETPSEIRGVRPPAARACYWSALFGAATGIAIAFGAGTPLFSPWFAALEHAQYGGAPLEEPARRLAQFFFGPIGGCTLAQFVMLAGLAVHEAGTARTAWTGAISIAAWFAIDSGYGAAHGGLFNIRIVNVPAVVVTLPPWLMLARAAGTAGRALRGTGEAGAAAD